MSQPQYALEIDGLENVSTGQWSPTWHFASAPVNSMRCSGPNGAGKTTILRMVAGLLKPDAGRIAI